MHTARPTRNRIVNLIKRRRFAVLIGAGLLIGCQTLPADRPPFGIETRGVGDADLFLTSPWIGETRGMIFVHGKICQRSAAMITTLRLTVIGFDEKRRVLFQREIGVRPPTGNGCRRYATGFAGVRTLTEIEVRAVPLSADAR